MTISCKVRTFIYNLYPESSMCKFVGDDCTGEAGTYDENHTIFSLK